MTAAFSFARADNGVDTITTGAGVAQIGSVLLTGGINLITSPTGQTAYRLPLNAAVGSPIVVVNNAGSTASALIFPPLNNDGTANGANIQGGSANASVTLAAGKTGIFFPLPATAAGVCSYSWSLSA